MSNDRLLTDAEIAEMWNQETGDWATSGARRVATAASAKTAAAMQAEVAQQEILLVLEKKAWEIVRAERDSLRTKGQALEKALERFRAFHNERKVVAKQGVGAHCDCGMCQQGDAALADWNGGLAG